MNDDRRTAVRALSRPDADSRGRLSPLLNRARVLARGVLAGLRTAHAALLLLVSARSKRMTEFWIGDSNAVGFNTMLNTSRLMRGEEGQFIWHRGPRLMYSLGRDGFPPSVYRVARLLGRIAPRGTILPVFSAGEVDVRCHLVPRAAADGFGLAFVADYISHGCRVAAALRSDHAVFAVSLQSEHTPRIPEFPIRGSLEDRMGMSERVRQAMIDAVGSYDGSVRPVLLDATDLLSDEMGLRLELTVDGIHTNEQGIQLVRRRFHELGLLDGEGRG